MYRSRLQMMEEKRDTRLAVLIFIFIIVLIVLLGLFGLKFLPRLVNMLSNSNRVNNDKVDLIPPPPPTLSIPYVATNSATINLTGQSEPGSQVYLTHDKASVGNIRTDNDGIYKMENVSLNEGNNSFRLVAMDPAGNQSPPSKEYLVEFISKAPELNIESLEDGQTVSSKKLTIKGSTNPQNRLYLSDRFVMLGSTGTFETTVNLNVGENKLIFVVLDRAEGRTQKELTVNLE